MFDFLVDIVAKDNYIESYINPNDMNLNDYFDKNELKKENEENKNKE